MTTYVVGVDGSVSARAAADRAAELAVATGGSLHVVCAYSEPRSGSVLSSGPAPPSALQAAERVVADQVEAFRRRGLDATSAVAEGKPAKVLLERAAAVGADAIVVGNKRMQGVARVLGSIANEVAHQAPCDVLIVKTV